MMIAGQIVMSLSSGNAGEENIKLIAGHNMIDTSRKHLIASLNAHSTLHSRHFTYSMSVSLELRCGR